MPGLDVPNFSEDFRWILKFGIYYVASKSNLFDVWFKRSIVLIVKALCCGVVHDRCLVLQYYFITTIHLRVLAFTSKLHAEVSISKSYNGKEIQ